MAQMLLIMGESGTGKSTSMRNCDPATTAVVNPVGNQFCIQYFPQSAKKQRECADVAERMYDCLEYITTDGDTKPIRGSKMNHQVVDGVLNFFVNYDFFTVKTEDQTPMETMTASTDVKEGG